MSKKQTTQLALFLCVTLAFVLLAVTIGFSQGNRTPSLPEPDSSPVSSVAN